MGLPKVVKPCAAGDYYKINPDEKMELNLKELAPSLEKAGFRLGLVSGVMLAFAKEGREYSLFPNGKMMVKGVESVEEALEAAEEVYKLIAPEKKV